MNRLEGVEEKIKQAKEKLKAGRESSGEHKLAPEEIRARRKRIKRLQRRRRKILLKKSLTDKKAAQKEKK